MPKNNIIIGAEVSKVIIPFYGSCKEALVDTNDIPLIQQTRWYVLDKRGYVVNDTKVKGKRKRTFLHRLISGANQEDCVDHINHNPLDNRRSNLRICTKKENSVYSKSRQNTSSKYKGVNWYKPYKKWRARVNRKHIGYFSEEECAARAHDHEAIREYGEFAYLNGV